MACDVPMFSMIGVAWASTVASVHAVSWGITGTFGNSCNGGMRSQLSQENGPEWRGRRGYSQLRLALAEHETCEPRPPVR
jgi:hypothetical protein